jgi:hypothetical protein
MPDASSVGMANVATVFLDVGDEQDLRMLGVGIMGQEETFDGAKTAREVAIPTVCPSKDSANILSYQ